MNSRLICIIFIDYDECSQNTDACDQNADCTNTVGSHTCQCRSGYTGDGITCTGKNLIEFKNICIPL